MATRCIQLHDVDPGFCRTPEDTNIFRTQGGLGISTSVPVATVAAFALLAPADRTVVAAVAIWGATVAYGVLLTRLARSGWLPFPEGA